MGADLEKLRKEYRPSMDAEVLHSWAADVVAALSAASQPAPEVKEPTHKHLKSGHLVCVIGTGRMQAEGWFRDTINGNARGVENVDMREVVIYEHAGNLWARPVEEFNDGRFEAVPTPAGESEREPVAMERLGREFEEAWDKSTDKLYETDAVSTPPSPAQGTVERAREVAWLIERKDNAVFQQPHWYHEEPSGWHWWTRDANEAKRFASRAEAQAYHAYQAVASDPAITITEHMWINDGFSWSHGRASPLREENERLKAKIESLEDNGTRLSDMLIEASQSERDDD